VDETNVVFRRTTYNAAIVIGNIFAF